MTTITTMMLLTLTMTVVLVPRSYWTFIKTEGLAFEQEKMQELLAKREWVLRHQCCSLVALVLAWIMRDYPGFEIPVPLAAAIAVYAASSLFLVVLESLLAQRIECLLTSVPVGVKLQD